MLIYNFIGNIKLRVLSFGYVMGVHVTIMYINFQVNLQVCWKLQYNSFNTAPNELKHSVWVKDGEVKIPTKIWRKSEGIKIFVKFSHFR